MIHNPGLGQLSYTQHYRTTVAFLSDVTKALYVLASAIHFTCLSLTALPGSSAEMDLTTS